MKPTNQSELNKYQDIQFDLSQFWCIKDWNYNIQLKEYHNGVLFQSKILVASSGQSLQNKISKGHAMMKKGCIYMRYEPFPTNKKVSSLKDFEFVEFGYFSTDNFLFFGLFSSFCVGHNSKFIFFDKHNLSSSSVE
jgi:glucan biosynthesis protein